MSSPSAPDPHGIQHALAQHDYAVRFDWGPDGVAALGGSCAVLVVVDVLSFTTTVDIVVGRGSRVRPTTWAPSHPYALRRPADVLDAPAGQEFTMASPNGATLCAAAGAFPVTVFAGCLRNAKAVARAAHAAAGDGAVGVIAAGERWGVSLASTDGPDTLRPAVEDHVGAGAIVDALLAADRGQASPEALAAAAVFRHTDVAAALRDCASGRELTAGGNDADVELAATLNCSRAAPVLIDGVLRGS